ncbi:hypothetical protein BJX66DRAFT_348055 [Aspergillus keveii]|uniref:Zn(2)-C6 fungal-type domain-containing protein n=1 Tax=Aspergillus keveii TaxID=714993 RepID=A0ABR4FNC5_9EURO
MASLALGRRAHRKSKAGCLQCKRRKVKCDEVKPVCRNCARHNVSCSFGGVGLSALPQHNLTGSCDARLDVSSPVSQAVVVETASPPLPVAIEHQIRHDTNQSHLRVLPTLPLLDMELLHHYTTSTCYTLSSNQVVQAIWRDEAPRVGFSMPAVLHALLAVSALHLARSDPARRETCLAHAHIHHNTAVQLVTPHLPSLASDNGVGLFLFSALTCIFACCATAHAEFDLFAEQGRLAEWVRLIRGMKTVIEHSNRNFLTTPLRPMFVYGSRLTTTSCFQNMRTIEQGRESTRDLREAIYREFSNDHPVCDVYGEALDGLSRTLGVAMAPAEGPVLQTGDVFAWILELSDEYLDLLLHEDPFALVIFAYFCVALRQIEWMWWADRLSGRLLMQIYTVLDERYHCWMIWPQEQINL